MGALTMLAYFHYVSKGKHPFTMALDEAGLQEVARSADLNPEQTQFVKDTAINVKEKGMVTNQRRRNPADMAAEASMRNIKDSLAFGHDLYWVAQLFDEHWKPWPTYT